MANSKFTFEAPLWRHEGPAAWHFLTLPKTIAEEIRDDGAAAPRPFGSVPVTAEINSVAWKTSIFADNERESYLLPVKSTVRKSAAIGPGDSVQCTLEIDVQR